MTLPLTLCAAAALIDPDNRILIQERPEAKYKAGFWEFPGGKLETGETPEQALVRELREELGITTIDAKRSLASIPFAPAAYNVSMTWCSRGSGPFVSQCRQI